MLGGFFPIEIKAECDTEDILKVFEGQSLAFTTNKLGADVIVASYPEKKKDVLCKTTKRVVVADFFPGGRGI